MMHKSNHLLRRLEPPIRPDYAGSKTTAPRSPLETQSFGQLLSLVSDGAVQSGRAVTLGYEPEEELDDEQMQRLAAAADLAESAGVGRALMLIDGRGLVLDVPQRHLESELSDRDQDPIVGLDAAVYVTGEAERSGAGAMRFPGTGLVPPVVAEQIQRAHEAGQHDLDLNFKESNFKGHRPTG